MVTAGRPNGPAPTVVPSSEAVMERDAPQPPPAADPVPPVAWETVLKAALAGAALVAAPRPWRQGVISAIIVFHFGGIFMATASPPPTPWLVEQMFQRVYNPYLQFMYLRNAYHFYSPEPGPASLLCFLL